MYTFALVGCGRIAQRHAELLNGQVAGAKLVAVCDIDESKADVFARKYGVAGFRDIDTMMREARPDVVSVLTPSGMHARHVLQLAPYGKHIVVEKPMALTLDESGTVEIGGFAVNEMKTWNFTARRTVA